MARRMLLEVVNAFRDRGIVPGGTCRTGVVEGTPDHRDEFLTNEERNSNNVVMICCSRSKTQVLALDL
jgi:hypothetical protein